MACATLQQSGLRCPLTPVSQPSLWLKIDSKNREPSINSRWEKRLFLPGRDDRFRKMRAAKCHRDGGLTCLSFTYPWWKAPGGRLTDGWRLPSFRLLRKMRKVRLGLVEAVRGQGLYQWSIMDQNPERIKGGEVPVMQRQASRGSGAEEDRGRKRILLFWGLTDNSAGQRLVAICVDKQSQWEFRLDTNHMLSPLLEASSSVTQWSDSEVSFPKPIMYTDCLE